MSAFGPRATGQGRGDRGDAKVIRCCAERSDSPQTLRADNAGADHETRLIHSRASSAANAAT